MDSFDNDYYHMLFHDSQEKEVKYSTCYSCKEDIIVGEEVLDVLGVCVHDRYDCLFKAAEARRIIAGKE